MPSAFTMMWKVTTTVCGRRRALGAAADAVFGKLTERSYPPSPNDERFAPPPWLGSVRAALLPGFFFTTTPMPGVGCTLFLPPGRGGCQLAGRHVVAPGFGAAEVQGDDGHVAVTAHRHFAGVTLLLRLARMARVARRLSSRPPAPSSGSRPDGWLIHAVVPAPKRPIRRLPGRPWSRTVVLFS